MSFNPDNVVLPGANIKVVGIGGGGGNAVSTMIRAGVEGVQFITLNTDIQALRYSLSPIKIQVGKELTKGLGAGADPDIGRDAALEDRHEIQAALEGADMVFVTAGMGGGTGTGGTSIVAQIARELGALTVGVVTKPFDFEGKRRKKYAEMGIARLRESVDTLITIPNQRLLQIATPDLSMISAFRMADDVLVNAVKGISDIINIPGTINVDFADVKTIMSGMGLALMGIGTASGEGRAKEAAIKAISSPLLEDVDIEGATGILINITAGSHITLMEVNEACNIIQDAAHEDANIIFGAVIDESVGDEIRVTVIATGFPAEYEEQAGRQIIAPKTSTYFNHDSSILTAPRTIIKPQFGGISKPLTSSKPYAPAVHQPLTQPVVTNTKIGASAFDGVTSNPVFQPITRTPETIIAPSLLNPEEIIATPISVEATQVSSTATQASMYEDNNSLQELTRMTMQDEPAIEQGTSHLTSEVELQAQEFDFTSTFEDEIPLVMEEENPFEQMTQFTAEEEPLPYFDEHTESSQEITVEPQLMETHFLQEEPMFTQEFGEDNVFDQKIDEALELAERLQNDIKENYNEDNLDVPAFLRNDIGDISLD